MNLVPDGSVVRGIRPEHVRLGSGDAAAVVRNGKVAAVEYMGADTIVTLLADGHHRIALRLAGPSGIRVGDALSVHWAHNDENQFDLAGRRVEQAADGQVSCAGA